MKYQRHFVIYLPHLVIPSPLPKHKNSQTQKFSDEKKCCLINIDGNNNITIKQLTQKDSVEISVESKNDSDMTTNLIPDNQLYHNLPKETRQRNISQFNTCTKNGRNSGDTQQQQEKVLRPPKKSSL